MFLKASAGDSAQSASDILIDGTTMPYFGGCACAVVVRDAKKWTNTVSTIVKQAEVDRSSFRFLVARREKTALSFFRFGRGN